MHESSPLTATSLYRRPLPPGQVAFSSVEGRQLFSEALASGSMEGWFALAEQFHTQTEPAFCGLGSLVVALNALEIDPGRIWKGPWRWYGESMLDCCKPLAEVEQSGVTLDEFACLAGCNGARATTTRADHGSVDELREALTLASRSARASVVVASYDRAALGQTGSGHFSPLAGYHAARDLALILDVARFKYPPHWVDVPLLWQAMQGIDPSTGRARGWVVLEKGETRPTALYFRLLAQDGLADLVNALLEQAPALLARAATESPQALVSAWVGAMGTELSERLRGALRPVANLDQLSPEHRQAIAQLLVELRDTPAHAAVRVAQRAATGSGAADDVLATLLLALPEQLLATLPPATREALAPLREPTSIGPTLARDVMALREQLVSLQRWHCSLRGDVGDTRVD